MRRSGTRKLPDAQSKTANSLFAVEAAFPPAPRTAQNRQDLITCQRLLEPGPEHEPALPEEDGKGAGRMVTQQQGACPDQ